MTALQEMVTEFGCTVLNYTGNKIKVSYFYSEEMYSKYLKGVDCMQGMGIREINDKVDFSKLPSGVLVVVQNDGRESARYKYVSIFKATIEYKDTTRLKNQQKASLTVQIRKQKYGKDFNLLLTSGESINFNNLKRIKAFLDEKYGRYKITDWELYYE
ncbi:MAG: hypothetical protein PHS83_06555 [Clostridia bacterium]|nr:hypothetical protein [Clostridia bacterium]